jgi:membrane associated rhomboid family serine protease
VLIPIGHDETEVRRLPWVTFSLMSLCLLVLFATGTTSCDGSLPEWQAEVELEMERVAAIEAETGEEVEPELPLNPYQRWGLNPSSIRGSRLITHQFMHGGWLHLLGNMLLLFLLGPPIEDRWGRPFFLALYLTGGIFAALFFTSARPDADLPLVGASGAIAAVMGAYLVRLFRSRLRYFYFLLLRVGTFEAPAWLMLPIWFLGEVWSARISDEIGGGGVAYWAHVGGFLYGMGFAGVMRTARIEERWLSARIEDKLTLVSGNPVVAEAQQLRATGRPEEAYERLRREMQRHREDPDVVVATWDAATQLGRASEMATELTGQLARWVADEELEAASSYWHDLDRLVPDAPIDPRILLVIARHLHELDRPLECRIALTKALGGGAEDMNPGLALRFFEVARERAPELATHAGLRALTWPELPAERRRDLEREVSLLAEQSAYAEAEEVAPRHHGWRGRGSRAIDLGEPIEAPELPSPSEGVRARPAPAPAPPVFDPNSATAAMPPPLPSSGPRWRDVKVAEVVPVELAPEGLRMTRGERTHVVPYARIQAIAAGTVHGLVERPVLLIDLALNWHDVDAESLQVVRLQSDRYDPRSLVPGTEEAMEAFRVLLRELLERSGAAALPDADTLLGASFSTYPDLALYESVMLDVTR